MSRTTRWVGAMGACLSLAQQSNATPHHTTPHHTNNTTPIITNKHHRQVGGAKDALEKLREVVELPLLHPERFVSLGIDPPKGVLLYG